MYASKSYKRLHFAFYMYAYIYLYMNAYIKMAFDIYASKLFERHHRRQFEILNFKSFQIEMIDACMHRTYATHFFLFELSFCLQLSIVTIELNMFEY